MADASQPRHGSQQAGGDQAGRKSSCRFRNGQRADSRPANCHAAPGHPAAPYQGLIFVKPPYRGLHRASPAARPSASPSRAARLLAAVAAVVAMLAGPAVLSVSPAGASTTYAGARMLDKAETRLNDSYGWGGTGPSSFDCSGLVYWAAGAAGERGWPRDTYGIAAQTGPGKRFVITTTPQRGDLAMWGSRSAPYHVEFVTVWRSTTFGAETYGWAGRVTWHYDGWFRPSYYLHILY